MDFNQREAIKLKIIKDIETTKKKIEVLKDLSKPIAPENAIGRVSRMDAINNRSISQAALELAEEKLIELKNILPEVDDPDFGMCIGCSKPIQLGRIMLMPHRRLCVRCAR